MVSFHPASTVVLLALMLVGCGQESQDAQPSTSAEDGALIEKARAIMTAVVEGRWVDARKDFDETMQEKLPDSTLAVAWAQYRKQFGEFVSQDEAEVIERPGFKVVNIAMTMKKREGQARITFNDKGKVAGLFFLRTGVPVP